MNLFLRLSAVIFGLAIPMLAGESTGDAAAAIATVNGETITADQLAKGIAPGLFGSTKKQAKQLRLEQLIELIALRQRLHQLQATPDEAEVDHDFEVILKRPPAMTCGCHAYQNYDDYLIQSGLTREDARLRLWIGAAIRSYVDRMWEQAHPGAAGKAALLSSEGPPIRARSRRVWINSVQFGPDDSYDTPKKGSAAWNRVNAAMYRIRQGEDAATVGAALAHAETYNNDDPRGTIMPIEALTVHGISSDRLAAQNAGMADEPISQFGLWMIVHWAPLSDDDVLGTLKTQFDKHVRSEDINPAATKAVVQYVGEGVTLAPAATTTAVGK